MGDIGHQRAGVTKNGMSHLIGEIRGDETHDAEHSVPLTTILDSFVNHPMLDGNLIGACFRKVRHSSFIVAEVDLSETLIE